MYLVPTPPGGICLPLTGLNPLPFLFLTRSPGLSLSTEIGSISEVFESEFGFHFLEVIDKRNYEQTNDLIRDRAYNLLYARKYEEELENTLRTMRAEAFVEFKDLD